MEIGPSEFVGVRSKVLYSMRATFGNQKHGISSSFQFIHFLFHILFIYFYVHVHVHVHISVRFHVSYHIHVFLFLYESTLLKNWNHSN